MPRTLTPLLLLLLTSLSTLAEIHLTRSIIPLFNDGSESTLAEFTFPTDRPRTLKSIQLSTTGTTDLADITFIGIQHLRQAGNRWIATTTDPQKNLLTPENPSGLDFPHGNHKCRILIKTRPGANLLHRIAIHLHSITFTDGQTLTNPSPPPPPARLAHRIHRTGEHHCHTFRIPGLARANDGSLLAVYDMRYNSAKDLQEHMDIGLSRSTDGGQTWSTPKPIMDMGQHGGKPQNQNGCSDPNILVDTRTGTIFVTALWTHGKPGTHQWTGKGSEPGLDIHQTSQFMLVRSSDHGITWSAPENLTSSLKNPAWHLFAPAPGNGITLTDGTLVIPTQGRDSNGLPFSNITTSTDRGNTWTVSPPARTDTTESAVAQTSSGTLLLSMRDNRNRADKSNTNGRALSTTSNLGKTWQTHPADHNALPEPVCMASLISHTLPDGRHLLLFSNPRDKHHRRNITIQASLDDGLTWPEKHHLLLDDSTGYGYSSLTLIDPQTIGILYESSIADMIFQKIPLTDLSLPTSP